ncbi:MAG: pyridoxamine 5'-phosphate oxidase family protein [Actinomycetota bacterium]
MPDDAYIEVLDRAECLRLLPSVPTGWLAFCHGSRPQLVVVNFLLYEGEVVARTGYGDKLAAAVHEAVMTFGAGYTEPATRTGWSVTATGRARLIDDLDDLATLEVAPLRPWAPGDKEFYIGVALDEVTGRRIVRAPSP